MDVGGDLGMYPIITVYQWMISTLYMETSAFSSLSADGVDLAVLRSINNN